MVTLTAFLTIYLVGGLTFLPFVVCLVLAHAYYTFPIHQTQEPPSDEAEKPQLYTGELSRDLSEKDLAALPPGTRSSSQERDVAAGYFAVCREFVPGGVNGKPPERTTPAGEIVAVESPSVYQSMYRSIFDRGKVVGPTIENVNGKKLATKNGRNVFYIVLRLGHLMLYDDAEQLDVRHVISLALYDIDIFAGGEKIPEGELFVKRNCIRLKRRQDRENPPQDSKPFFLFSDNCSEKEDFYRALLQNQDHVSGAMRRSPEVLQFERDHIVKLVQQLHASGENLQTRWFNALIGRLFLSLYKTKELNDLIHSKITKKINRVPKPAFIEEISVKNIDMGDSAPIFTNPKLRELTIDGDLTIEADVKYNGNFRLEIAAVAIIDLGPRFKPRKINILLAAICKRLEGHLLIRVKPPPSNRFWISFEHMPQLDLSIEPIVSSRQITYGLILRAIESRIREAMADTLVLPNWDDIPFSDSIHSRIRGGIWLPPRHHGTDPKDEVIAPPKSSEGKADIAHIAATTAIKTMSTPTLVGRRRTSAGSNSSSQTTPIPSSSSAIGIASGFDGAPVTTKPKGMRSNSFATVASPVVSSDVHTRRESHPLGPQDAASVIKDIHSRSQTASPVESPVGSPSQSQMDDLGSGRRRDTFAAPDPGPEPVKDFSYASSIKSDSTSHPSIESGHESSEQELVDHLNRSLTDRSIDSSGPTKRQSIAANAAPALAAARKWGVDFIAKRQAAANANVSHEALSNVTASESTQSLSINSKIPAGGISSGLGSPSNPIGRGHPHGTPIPRSTTSAKTGWTAALGSLTKRKPVPAISRPEMHGTTIANGATVEARGSASSLSSSDSPPPLPQRHSKPSSAESLPSFSTTTARRKSSKPSTSEHASDAANEHEHDQVLVIKAPEDGSESPLVHQQTLPKEAHGAGDEDNVVSTTQIDIAGEYGAAGNIIHSKARGADSPEREKETPVIRDADSELGGLKALEKTGV